MSAPPRPLPQWNGRIVRNWRRLHDADRATGIDLARGLAVLGMLTAHLLWTTPLIWTEPATWTGIASGRSSILFATLAGVSLGLITGGATPVDGGELGRIRSGLVIRALTLWCIGVALIGIDVPISIILPAYAIIFLLALPFLTVPAHRVLALAATIAVIASPLVVWLNTLPWTTTLDGWIFATYTAWNYPFPLWIAFTLTGLGFARLGLHRLRLQWGALCVGTILAIAAYSLAAPEQNRQSRAARSFWEAWWTADPHSNGILEVAGSGGFAIAVIALCLLISRGPWTWLTFPIRAVGSMPLTAYVGQIIGWAISSAIVLGSTHEHAYRDLAPFLPITLVTILSATLWSLIIGRGPLETLLGWVSRPARQHPRPSHRTRPHPELD